MEKNFFEDLYDTDVRDRMYSKQGLTYLPWATAYSEIAKKYPDVNYEFVKYGEGQIPYVETPLGIMVHTKVTVNNITREMYLPVMDGANKAMKSEPYTYKTKSGEKEVAAATMFDINKSLMRCLAKNFAMFGIGLHLWTKEEAPEAVLELSSIKNDIMEIIAKKCALSDKAKEEVGKLCKDADSEANGDPRLIEDIEILKSLKKSLLAVRK